MNTGVLEAICRKRDGKALSPEQIAGFVRGVTDGSIPDYQLGAMLMAIYLKGMDQRETVDLTIEMARSGDMLNLDGVEGVKVDKHSTGGVGDTTTLILAPLAAACGAKVAKMSGRGLGHTGGTLDKLESIPGMSVSLSPEAFVRQVNRIGLAIVGQTGSLVPADKKLYALRDVTGTVGSLPLVVSSVLSKKIASGADVVVLDVKAGNGSVMPTLEGSMALARSMVEIGCRTGRRFCALVTDMDQPLGTHIGNALEVKEAISVLQGACEGPLKKVSLQLAARMLTGGGLARDVDDALVRLEAAIQNGASLQKLAEMIRCQGGDPRVTEDTDRLPGAKKILPFESPCAGYVASMDTMALGNGARLLGAGRIRQEDAIDPAVGLVMRVRLGDRVEKGQPLLDLHLGEHSDLAGCTRLLEGAFTITGEKPDPRPLIHSIVEGPKQ